MGKALRKLNYFSRSSELHNYATLLCLYLMRTSLPYIKPRPSKGKAGTDAKSGGDKAGAMPTPEDGDSDRVAMPSAVLTHLCQLLDSPETEERITWLAQDIVTEGVVVFFPDAKARKSYLLSMIDSILVRATPPPFSL